MHPDPNLNALWCRCLAEELQRAGVERAVLCPGSRNSPLLFALAMAFGEHATSHIEERSAAFMALGMARATGRPAVVCVTSGSAVANCLPAMVEAQASAVPLIVVAADRPWELRACGAPQTMPQAGAFSAFLAEELALCEPLAEDGVLRTLRSRVSRLAQRRDGPVLINVPLRDPLPPLADPDWLLPAGLSDDALHGRDGRPYTLVGSASGALHAAHQAWNGVQPRDLDWLRPGLRGLIVAGPNQGGQHPQLALLARHTGYPLLADAPSGLRLPEVANLVVTADALVGGPLGERAPELVIVADRFPLARATAEYLARQDCPLLLLEDGAPGQSNRDLAAGAWASVLRPGPEAFRALAAALSPGDADWREEWLAADRRARERLVAAMAEEPWGEVLAAHLAINHPGFDRLHLASSLAVRHGNLHLLPRAAQAVDANRGVNGIDGTIATFIGTQLCDGGGGLLLCGDLAFLHDLPALAALAHTAAPAPMALVVINNHGGGIFDFLPVAEVPGYQRWVRTPHRLDFAHAAAQFGLTHRLAEDAAGLVAALDEAAAADRPLVIECAVAAGDVVERHRALLRAMAAW